MYGQITAVESQDVGTETLFMAPAGATVLVCPAVGDFSDQGGRLILQVGETDLVADYAGVDLDAGLIRLSAALPVEVPEGTLIKVDPPVNETTAEVNLDATGDFPVEETGSVRCQVPHALKPFLEPGIRDDRGEQVQVEATEDGVWRLVDVIGQSPVLIQDVLPDIEIGPDGLAPATSPVPRVAGTIGALLVSWDPVVNADPVQYQVHISAVAGFTPGSSTLVITTASSSATIRTLNGVALAYDTSYYVRVVATDADGAANPSPEVAGQLVRATNADIAADFVYAGKVLADQIQSGGVTADLLLSGLIRTAVAGSRVEVGVDGIRVYTALGELVTNFPTDAKSVFKGDVEAEGVTVNGSFELKGADNHVAGGSALVLDSGQQPPVTAPAVTHYWPTRVTLKDAAGVQLTGVRTVSQYGTGWVSSTVDARNNAVLRTHDAQGACTHTLTGLNATWEGYYGPEQGPLSGVTGVVRVGNEYIVAAFPTSASAPQLYRYALAGANPVLRRQVDQPNEVTALCTDGASVFGILSYDAGDKVIDTWVFSKDLATATKTSFTGGSGTDIPALGMDGSAFLFAGGADGQIHALNSDRKTLNPNADYAQAAVTTVGVGKDATGYWSALADGTIRAHDGTNWSGAYRRYCDYVFTWYDSRGTVRETLPGPRQRAYALKRARTTVTTAKFTPSATDDEVDSVRIYAGLTGATLYLQAPASGSNTVNFQNLVISGTAAPTVNTFPAGGLGVIRNQSGTVAISADGTIKGRVIPTDDTGWVPIVVDSAVGTASGDLAYRVRGGWVTMRGIVTLATATTTSARTMFALPVGARPPGEVRWEADVFATNAGAGSGASVQTGGNVVAYQHGTAGGTSIRLASCPAYLAAGV